MKHLRRLIKGFIAYYNQVKRTFDRLDKIKRDERKVG